MGDSFEIKHPRSSGWKNIGCRWTRGMGDLKNETIFMDVIFVSSLRQNVQINSGFSAMTMKIQYKCGKRYLAKAGSKKLSLFTKKSRI